MGHLHTVPVIQATSSTCKMSVTQTTPSLPTTLAQVHLTGDKSQMVSEMVQKYVSLGSHDPQPYDHVNIFCHTELVREDCNKREIPRPLAGEEKLTEHALLSFRTPIPPGQRNGQAPGCSTGTLKHPGFKSGKPPDRARRGQEDKLVSLILPYTLP